VLNASASAPALTAAELAAPAALLLPYQCRFLADPARVKVWEKSRRIGASWCIAGASVLDAASGTRDVYYVAYSEDAGKQFLRDVADFCEHFHLPAQTGMVDIVSYDDDDRATNIRTLAVTFPGSNKRIVALTSAARALRGKRGRVIADESAFIDDLDEVLKAATAFLAWPDGEMWILSTHNGESNAFAALVNDIRDGKCDFSLHRTTILDALAEGLFKRMCLTEGTEWNEERERAWLAQLERDYRHGVREELYCEPVGAGQSYLPKALVSDCMVDDAPVLRYALDDDFMALPEDMRTAIVDEWLAAEVQPWLDRVNADGSYRCSGFGFDFGRSADLSVLAPICLRQNMSRKVPFMLELRQVPYTSQLQVLKYVVSRLPLYLFGALDATGSGGWLAEQAQLNFGESRVDCILFTLAYYRDHFPSLRRQFEDKTLQIPRDLDVLSDLALVRRINGIPKLPDVRTDSISSAGKRHGDSAIALLLANAAIDKAETIYTRWKALTTL
jgi:phage FluMu gp28-like protein